MRNIFSTDTTASISSSSAYSIGRKNYDQFFLSNSDSDSKNKKYFSNKEPNDNSNDSSVILEEMIHGLESKMNDLKLKEATLNQEMKQVSSILDQGESSTETPNINNNFRSKFVDNNPAKISKKVEKYIDAISNTDEKIHEFTQEIDSEIIYIDRSHTELLKLQNKIDYIKFQIEKENRHHESVLKKYKNEFKKLANKRNEIAKEKIEKSSPKYYEDPNMIKKYEKIKNKKEELYSEVRKITSKKFRSNDRLSRMESQLERLIQAENNLKQKSKEISRKDKKETLISNLLDKLDQKLNEKQFKKERELHKGETERQILLQTFDNLQQIIAREENAEKHEDIQFPYLPTKYLQNKINQNENNLTNISDEIEFEQNSIKYLKREIAKTERQNEKYRNQISELKRIKENQVFYNNYSNGTHYNNINLIYNNSNDLLSDFKDQMSQLSLIIELKRNEIDKRKRNMLSRCENYFKAIIEYGKKWQE